RNSNFTGRERQLKDLTKRLFRQDGPTKTAIWGLGGVGKTQILLELIYQIRENDKNCSVIWIPATNMESLHQAYKDVAKRLNLPNWDDDKADAKKLVQQYLSTKSAGRWVLAFDNADNIEM